MGCGTSFQGLSFVIILSAHNNMMNFESLHLFEIDLVRHLQVIRGSFLDQFMLFCNFFDTMNFYVILLICTWFGYDRKCGIRLLFLSLLNVVLNQDLKMIFAQPRPFELEPALRFFAVS